MQSAFVLLGAPNRDGFLRKLAAFFLQLRTGYKLGKACPASANFRL